MIRVLQVIGSLNNGGSQAMIMNIYRNIDRSKIQFDFIIDRSDEQFFSDEIIKLGGVIYVMPTFNLNNLFKFRKAWHEFFKEHPEYKIIHGHVRSTASIYLKIAKKYGLTTIAHSHSTSSGTGLSAIVKNILQHQIRYTAHYLIACSKSAGVWLFGEKACSKDNFSILNNAIDSKKYIYNKNMRVEKRKEFKIEDKFVIGNIGRFSSPKNHEFLIDIFKKIHDINNNAVLMIVGDGELRHSIYKKVNELGLSSSVIFAGVRSDVPDLLQAMDVFLFPSLYEGLGIAIVEAQATGLKCYVSDNLPKEVFITDLVKGISLKKSSEYWATVIINEMNDVKRKDSSEKIIKAGYDINDSAKWLENYYIEKNMPKILYWGMSNNLGGIETYLMNLVRIYKNKDIQIDFLTTSKSICFEDEIKKLGSNIYHIPNRRPNFILFYLALIKFFNKKRDYTAIHFFLQSCSSIEPVIIAKLNKNNTIVDSRSAYKGKKKITRLLDSVNKKILPFYTDEMLAISEVSGRSMFKRHKFKIVKSAVDANNYRYNPLVRETYRKELGISDKKVIGHVGRFAYEKNHSFLLDIFCLVHKKNPNTILLLVGDGKLMETVKEKAEKLGINDNVIFTGLRTDIPELMQAMDIFVFPSYFEGLGRSVIEAQATGLRTIVSDRIPDEVLITDLIKKICLDNPIDDWSNEIINLMEGYERKDTYDIIYNSSYDIKSSAKMLREIYLKYY